MVQDFPEQTRIYGTLPTREMHIHQIDAKPLYVSSISRKHNPEFYCYKKEGFVSKSQERRNGYQHTYSRNCQDILRKSQQNQKLATLPSLGYPLSNPYSRHSVAVMDFHPHQHFPRSEFDPLHGTLYSSDWKLTDSIPVHRQQLYRPRAPREHRKMNTTTTKVQSKSLTSTLASRYPLHTVNEQEFSPSEGGKQLEISGELTGVREKHKISDLHFPMKLENRTTMTNIYNSHSAFNPTKRKKGKVSLTVCKAACLFLVVSNLFFVLIIGCVVFSE